jgi:erythromycin esterase
MLRNFILLIGCLILNIGVFLAQSLSAIELNYLNKNSTRINVDESYQNGNWKAMLDRIEKKRIVLLGEFNHGSKEIFITRNDLIKSLHEKLGYNVVLFEAGIGEVAVINFQSDERSPKEMTYGFFGIWRTGEFVDLMKYIKENDISIAGYDVQRSGNSFDVFLKEESEKLDIDSMHYANLEERFSQEKSKLENRKTEYDSVEPSTLKLIKDYENIYNLLHDVRSKVKNKKLLLVQKTISNRIKFLTYMLEFVKNKDWNKRWAERDVAMAANIDWLISNFYRDEKIIVVGHNFHISKFNENEDVMGEFLKTKYGNEMYSLGVFAGAGSYAGNSGEVKKMSEIDVEKLDIRRVINSLSGKVNFLNIPNRPEEEFNWLFKKIVLNDSFIDLSNSNEIILSKHFDGLLLIDKITPPEKY